MAGNGRGRASGDAGTVRQERQSGRLGLVCGAALAGLVLTGCEQAGTAAEGGGESRERATVSRSVQIVERDVEAPEVFQVADQGLWDGRPSLGGVWVAHAAVGDPERVIIRNDTTGEFVIGALFRRERENPGPRLQVSSDAASALGMLAGQPARLSVTALRREEVAPEPPAPRRASEPEPAPVAVAAAEPPAAAAPAAPAPNSVETAALATETDAAPRPAAAAEERPRGLAGLFRRRAPEPEITAEAVAAGIAAAPIETQTLQNVTATAAAALDRVDGGAGAAAPTPAQAATTPATGARSVSAPGATDRPFVQVGIFSVEANADRAAALLRGNGHAAVIRQGSGNGRSYWRVLAGPAETGPERDRLVAAVRGLGFGDAYAVRN